MRDKHLKHAVKKLPGFGGNGRSTLHRYIASNFQILSGRNIGNGGPTWEEITDVLNARGQCNSRGEVLTVIAVKRVFQRVARDLASNPVRQPRPQAPRVRAPADWRPVTPTTSDSSTRPIQPTMATLASAGTSQRADKPASLLTKPKTEAQRIADIAMTKHPQDRTPEEKLAVTKAERERRSYTS